MVFFKGRLCLVLLLLSLLTLCVSIAVAREDPELRQCKHQCKHQRQFDRKQEEQCERACEEYIKEKERIHRRMGEEEEEEVESNPRRDPEDEYKKCRERCQEGEQGRRKEQVCESHCEEIRRRKQIERDNSEEKTGERSEGEESGNPYVFEDEHFSTKFRTQEGKVRVLQKFTKRSNLLRGIENFRVMIFEANPHTFVIPNHWDADVVFFVAKGKGTVTLVHTDKRESFNVEHGHIMFVPAGVTVYAINRDNDEKLVLVKLINPVSSPGNFVPFFGPGGRDPESFFNAFSDGILEAAFKTPRDRLQRIFSQQKEGVIVKASKEQIRSMTHEQGTHWPFGGKGSKESGPFHLLKQHPKESNEFGRLFEADSSDYKQLQNLDIAISFANITRGSMHTPFYNSRVTKIAVVVNGRGYFEMACPHVGSSSKGGNHHRHGGSKRGEEGTTPIHYGRISSELRPGMVVVVPTGHPFVTLASQDEDLEVICFELNAENNRKFPLAGQRNIMKNLEKEAKELAFATSAEEVDRVFESQEEEFFFRGPRRHHQQLQEEEYPWPRDHQGIAAF